MTGNHELRTAELYRLGHRRKTIQAQTTVMIVLALGVIITFVGLAIDSGLLYLAKARLVRAADGAALAAVGNFHRDNNSIANRYDVSEIMRNFAVANYPDLGINLVQGSVSSPQSGPSSYTPMEVAYPYTTTTGATATYYVRTYLDGSPPDTNGVYRRFVRVTLYTGAGGQITSAICEVRCPVTTYFITTLLPALGPKMRVSASSTAKRNPRLIVVVVDRSASMLNPGGGAVGLPVAINTFMNFFDPAYDTVGIVSFSSNARVEVAPTTNFLEAETNDLYKAYSPVEGADYSVPTPDAENTTDPNYVTTGIRRFKFGGDTAADEGIRLGIEQMEQNSGFSDPDVNKIMVIFTDGAWNNARTLWAAPGYTNVVTYVPPVSPLSTVSATPGAVNYAPNISLAYSHLGYSYLQSPSFGDWSNYQYSVADTAPTELTNFVVSQHTNDQFQSCDPDSTNEPFSPTGTTELQKAGSSGEGVPLTIEKTNTQLYPGGPYSTTLDVWLQPGAVDFDTRPNANGTGYITNVYVSDFTNPTQEQLVELQAGSTNTLQVPGYLVDGLVYDGLDLEYPSNPDIYINMVQETGRLSVRADNYLEPFMWPDDGAPSDGKNPPHFASTPDTAGNSTMRRLLYRNYANLLTGYIIFRPDDPATKYGEPLDPTELFPVPNITMNADIDKGGGYPRRSYGLGPYYPSAGFYWPFDGVGAAFGQEYALTNAIADPSVYTEDPYSARFLDYSINMLSPAAAPEWAGELFYSGTQGPTKYSDETLVSGLKNVTTNVSSLITNVEQWQTDLPSYAQAFKGNMISDPVSNTVMYPISGPTPAIWRPNTFIGQNQDSTKLGPPLSTADIQAAVAKGEGFIISGTNYWINDNQIEPGSSQSQTGGYVIDGTLGNNYPIYYNSEAWSGRPTHYFDISSSVWRPITNNHNPSELTLPLGNWKAREYAWHARQLGVKIYTVGYGSDVNAAEQVLLAQVANATNSTAFPTTVLGYDSTQPVGQQFYAQTSQDISNDFYQVGQAINAYLSQ